MDYWLGIDLGSTTTKAVVLNDKGKILGRGITNSRSDYDVACQVSLGEALTNTRFDLISQALEDSQLTEADQQAQMEILILSLRENQYRNQLASLQKFCSRYIDLMKLDKTIGEAVEGILSDMEKECSNLYAPGTTRKSDFFRDLASSRYMSIAEDVARESKLPYDMLVAVFDKAILEVENEPEAAGDFTSHANRILESLNGSAAPLTKAIQTALNTELTQKGSVGTGYGRARLPFEEAKIRSEILCHGLGAHAMYPNTRTVLDIGGQDTKAIQVDGKGIVTSFQMNDRCAAGCGRYLGYIADEMNIGIQELGPIAQKSHRPARINSTCTVFAGAELRERLALGEKREDILAGLHRAIILRALSLLARSGGVEDEFTFTGGVANNPAAVKALEKLIFENYGERTLNISPDSIYTGALGAALFSLRDHERGSDGE